LSIERRDDDKRYLEVRVTSACLAHCKERGPKEDAFITTLFAGFSGEELSYFSQSFAKLSDNITRLEETHA
ncbi:MAG TPA: hypothetical protein VJ854_05590, partial [Sphaerochaeta sp.]|nr:hypothetical protein [Sphaerochaeta sp.]